MSLYAVEILHHVERETTYRVEIHAESEADARAALEEGLDEDMCLSPADLSALCEGVTRCARLSTSDGETQSLITGVRCLEETPLPEVPDPNQLVLW